MVINNIEERLGQYFPDLKGYRPTKVLGAGGQAISLLLDHPDGQFVGKLFEYPPLLASMLDSGKKIESESTILKQLKHPNIPQIKEVIEGKDALLSIREYIPGKTLDQIVTEKKFLTEEEALPIKNSVLDILDYLHDPKHHRNLDEPIIHRDIKPSNIIINEQGVYLIDFGVSHHKNRTFTTMTPKGTHEFMALEQFAGMANPSSDIYGLGATIITALMGKTPKEIIEKREYVISNRDISYNTRQVLEKMVKPDAKHRFVNATEVKTALECGEGGNPPLYHLNNQPLPYEKLAKELNLKLDKYKYSDGNIDKNALGVAVHKKITSLFGGRFFSKCDWNPFKKSYTIEEVGKVLSDNNIKSVGEHKIVNYYYGIWATMDEDGFFVDKNFGYTFRKNLNKNKQSTYTLKYDGSLGAYLTRAVVALGAIATALMYTSLP